MPIKSVSFVCYVHVVDTATGLGKTGDAANLTFYTAKDGAAPTACTNAITESDSTHYLGIYQVTLTTTEMGGHSVVVSGKSVTSGIAVRPTYIGTDNGVIAALDTKLGSPAGASVSVDVAAVKVDTAAVKAKTDQMVYTVTNRLDATVTTANVKTGVDSALDTANTELASAPAAGTATLRLALQWVYSLCRHKVTSNKTTGVRTVYKADSSTTLATTTATDDGTTFTKPKDT